VSITKERRPAVTAGTVDALAEARRRRPWRVVAATAAIMLVLLCVRNRFLFSTRLYEDADMGANSILAEQARHFALLVGNYSRDHFHHPGPGYLYVKAAGESVFWAWLHLVPTAWNGQLLAVYVLNSMFVALIVGVGYAWTGSLRGAAACLAAVAALAAVHPAVLSSDWMPYLYVLAYLAFLAAAASVAAGRARDAWLMALAGWFCIHGHACFLFFVPVITCAVLAAVLWQRRHDLGAPVRSLGRQWRVWVPVLAISAVFALPIAINLALHWPGTFGDYARYVSSERSGGHSLARAAQDALWYWAPFRYAWLVPAAGSAAAVAVTRWLAPARLRRFLAALLAVNAVSTLAFLYYAMAGIDVLSEHYVGYFYWSAPVLTLLVIAVGLAEAIPPRMAGTVAAVAAAGLAVGLLAAAPGMRTSTDSSDPAVLSSGPDTDPALPGAVAALAARSGGRTIVLRFDQKTWPDVTGFLVQAERTGVRACVKNPIWTFMMTSQFMCTSQEVADGRLYWFRDTTPPNGPVIARLRQAFVTTVGPGHDG
jgi:hypothetical protein